MNAPIKIMSRRKFEKFDLSNAGYVIAIRSPGNPLPANRSDFTGFKWLDFAWHDTTPEALTLGEDIERLMNFSREWLMGKCPIMIVHCEHGVNRSTAAALLPLLLYCGSAEKATKMLFEIRPPAEPSPYIVKVVAEAVGMYGHDLERAIEKAEYAKDHAR